MPPPDRACGPLGLHDRRPRRPCDPAVGAPRETGGATGDTGGAPEIRVIRQRSSRAQPATGRPARRCGPEVGGPPTLIRSRDDSGTSGARATRPAPGRAGMGCWVRTAAASAAVRTPRPTGPGSEPGAEATPDLRADGSREDERGRSTGHAAPLPPPGPTAPHPADAVDRLPWRTLLAAVGRPGARAGLPRLRPRPRSPCSARPPWRSPSTGAAVPRPACGSGWSSGLAFFVPLLSWTGIYVGPFPWLALAVFEALHLALLGGGHRADVAAAVVAAVGGRALGGRRGAARTLRPRRLPLGPAGLQPDRRPAAVAGRLRRRARWSASPSP